MNEQDIKDLKSQFFPPLYKPDDIVNDDVNDEPKHSFSRMINGRLVPDKRGYTHYLKKLSEEIDELTKAILIKEKSTEEIEVVDVNLCGVGINYMRAEIDWLEHKEPVDQNANDELREIITEKYKHANKLENLTKSLNDSLIEAGKVIKRIQEL